MSALSPARIAAARALDRSVQRGQFVREVLPSCIEGLSVRDRAFALRLALGVARTQGTLDEFITRLVSRPRALSPRVRTALRIAVCEILFLATPDRAAVSQGVELTRRVAPAAAGMANAVLRRAARESRDWLAATDVPPAMRERVAAARFAGLPLWLSDLMDMACASHADSVRFSSFAAPVPCVQLMPGSDWLPTGEPLALSGAWAHVDFAALGGQDEFAQGRCAASDLCAQLVATAVVRPGTFLELGAGRGTKSYVSSCQAQRLGVKRLHYAVDLSAHKCQLNRERLTAAGFSQVRVILGDILQLDTVLSKENHQQFDTVFLDAPCTGTGTMRRHPEIPWRLSEQEVREDLPPLQRKLLVQAARHCAVGGELFYATCSVLPEENEQVVEAFLATEVGKRFVRAPFKESWALNHGALQDTTLLEGRITPDGSFQSFPDEQGFDGHFCARLVCVEPAAQLTK